MMHAKVNIHTPFHIDLGWWDQHGRSLRRFLAEILAQADADLEPADPLDFIDPQTAEVFQLDPLWVKVLTTRARKPDYITSNTPLTNAVLRAFIENVNQPMSAVDLQRRISRSNPETVLRVLRTARTEYGIVPLEDGHAA
jgi:hypothetical protein